MSIREWFSGTDPCKRFADNEQLFAGLSTGSNEAIVCLQTKAMPMVRQAVIRAGLSRDRTEEVLNESTLIFLRKIDEGSYEFRGHALTTYVVEVARRVCFSLSRRSRKETEPLENYEHLPHEDASERERREDAVEMVKRLLGKMSPECAQVIRLKHIDGYADAEVIEGKMTPYSTVNSLKMKRSGCMKKLIELAKSWKTSKSI